MLNAELAEKQKQHGMRAAGENADLFFNWQDEAFEILCEYARTRKNGEYMAEDVREYAHGFKRLPSPPSLRSWGGVIQRGIISGIIQHVGYAKTQSVKSHRTPASLYKTAVGA